MLASMLSELNRDDNEFSDLLYDILSDCPSEDDEVSSSYSGSDIQMQSAHKRQVPIDICSESTDSSDDSNSGAHGLKLTIYLISNLLRVFQASGSS
ncbi:hypothetical protein C0J52_02480 [Blattella germanica]|nr:hypothetical protein C0J52_02480 [Blattella germanica]